jgi:hypothetical protein
MARSPRRSAPTRAVLLATLAAVAAGCASTRPTQPLPPGRLSHAASVGGPLVAAVGAVLPTPILNAGAAYGATERLTAYGNVDLTALAFGTLHVEPGAVWHPAVPSGGAVPAPAFAASLHLLTDLEQTRVAPQLTALGSWTIAARHLIYAGADTALPIGHPTHLIAGPLVGLEWRRGRVGLGVEVKWLAPYHDVEPLAPTWISPGHHGYLSILLGARIYPQVPQ